MDDRRTGIKIHIGVGIIAAVVVWFLSLTFRNPDMTMTRLLLTYWPNYLAGWVAIAIGVLLAGEVI